MVHHLLKSWHIQRHWRRLFKQPPFNVTQTPRFEELLLLFSSFRGSRVKGIKKARSPGPRQNINFNSWLIFFVLFSLATLSFITGLWVCVCVSALREIYWPWSGMQQQEQQQWQKQSDQLTVKDSSNKWKTDVDRPDRSSVNSTLDYGGKKKRRKNAYTQD